MLIEFNQWKIVRLPEPYGDESRELYHPDTDPRETTNLAASMPKKTSDMVAQWNELAATTGIIAAEPDSRAPIECVRGEP
ncbi:MAG TPA: hypothetical protein DEO43_05080 [Halieaceae bacterium]|nr:hypothetical protein [Halieaceae bacterium]